MNLTITSISSDDLKLPITLCRLISDLDIIRNIPRPTLEIIGHFKAAIDEANITISDDNIFSNIYSLKKIFVRVSDFYRQAFIKNNYIRFNGTLMKIASVQYNRINGISCCMCYDVDEV